MSYKITPKVIALVEQLFAEGYTGKATLTSSYPTGAGEVLGNALSVELTGFCKESLYLVEDTDAGVVLFVGRYRLEGAHEDPTTQSIVDLAWSMYETHFTRGYGRPDEFEKPFIHHGYLEERVRTLTELIEVGRKE